MPLGIPLENIIGIERDQAIAQEIRDNIPGLEVVVSDVGEFLSNYQGLLDVINLDFQGHFKSSDAGYIKLITQNGIIRNGGVVATNFFAAREGKAIQERYGRRLMEPLVDLSIVDLLSGDRDDLTNLEEPRQTVKEMQVSDIRSDSISTTLWSCLSNGPDNTLIRYLVQLAETMDPEFVRQAKLFQSNSSVDLSTKEGMRLFARFNPVYKSNEFMLSKMIQKVLPELAHLKPLDMYKITHFILCAEEVSYQPADHQSFMYDKEDGKAKMFCDFMRVNIEGYKWKNDAVRLDFKDGKLRVMRGRDSAKRLVKLFNRYMDQLDANGYRKENRSYLDGITHEELWQGYERPPPFKQDAPLLNNQYVSFQSLDDFVAGINATLADLQTQRDSMQNSREVDKTTTDHLSREDAIDLLKSGCTTHEIAESYPDSFSVMQLAGYKAQITRGNL